MGICRILIIIYACMAFDRSAWAQALAQKTLQLPSPERFRETSPFRMCEARLATLNSKHASLPRLQYLETVKREFKKQFLMDDQALNEAFAPVLITGPDDPSHQTQLEELTNTLNRLEFSKVKLTSAANNLREQFAKFDRWQKREPQSGDRNDECLEKPSRAFSEFANFLRGTLTSFFQSFEFGSALIRQLGATPLLPSGTRVFFGATTSNRDGVRTICANPEEETTLLLAKIMHELVHAKNADVKLKVENYERSRREWLDAKARFSAAEEQLVKFDDQVDPDSGLDFENLTDQISDLVRPSETVIRAILEKTAAKKRPYLRLTAELGMTEHAVLLAKWKEAFDATEKLKMTAFLDRTALDVERFLDEHVAYSIQLKSGWALIQEEPDLFCRKWVPSFQEKRPLRFFQAFEKLESQIYDGSFSEWLANEYSFVANNYLKTSLYEDGEKERGIKAEIKEKARAILAREFQLPSNPIKH